MMADALENRGSYAVWSGAGPPSLLEQRASTTDDLPKRSSLMRLAGVEVPSMAAGVVTDDALSSIDSCSRSFGSRTCSTRVSIMVLPSLLKEYCTVENKACSENSRRSLTQFAIDGSSDICALCPA